MKLFSFPNHSSSPIQSPCVSAAVPVWAMLLWRIVDCWRSPQVRVLQVSPSNLRRSTWSSAWISNLCWSVLADQPGREFGYNAFQHRWFLLLLGAIYPPCPHHQSVPHSPRPAQNWRGRVSKINPNSLNRPPDEWCRAWMNLNWTISENSKFLSHNFFFCMHP